jgi:hypothetical protein
VKLSREALQGLISGIFNGNKDELNAGISKLSLWQRARLDGEIDIINLPSHTSNNSPGDVYYTDNNKVSTRLQKKEIGRKDEEITVKNQYVDANIVELRQILEQLRLRDHTQSLTPDFVKGLNDIDAIIHHTVRDARYTMAAIGLGLSGNLMALSSIFFLSGTASMALLAAGSVFVISGIGVAGKLYFDNKAFNEEQLNQNQQQ